MKEKIRILIADDHFMVRMGLAGALNRQPGMTVVAEAASGAEAVELHAKHRPDVTLMDLRLPHLNGIEAAAAIRRDFPETRIIVLSAFDVDEDIRRALKCGVRAFLSKSIARDEFLRTIRAVHHDQYRFPREIAARMARYDGLDELTPREQEVLRLIVAGRSNKEIAAEFDLTEGTVKIHVTHVLGKLKVQDRTQAAMVAIQRGLIPPPAAPIG